MREKVGYNLAWCTLCPCSIHVLLQIDAKSELQGFPESRLPEFTAEESNEILGSSDFLGINFYTSTIVYPRPGDISTPSYYEDKDVGGYPDPNWYRYVLGLAIHQHPTLQKKSHGLRYTKHEFLEPPRPGCM